MERSSEHGDLAALLAEARPIPHEDFVKELDERVAAGFPRRSRLDGSPLAGFAEWVRALSPQRLLVSGAVALLVIAVVTVAMTNINSSPSEERSSGTLSLLNPTGPGDSSDSEVAPSTVSPPTTEGSAAAGEATGAQPQIGRPTYDSATGAPFKPESLAARHRDIERSAEVALLAAPEDVADDSAAVFAAVHDAHGIVLRSTTTSGKRAGADFDLLVPSAKLGDALAAFSAIDEVRSRHEATEDITAPRVSAGEELRDSRARIDGLLGRLASAETETEASAIEAELERERRHAASLRAQLEKLEQRSDFSRVSVKIETGESSTDSGGAWGISDAFDDAGHILGIAAGITLIGLAVIGPIALLCLLAWLTHRAWTGHQRKRALRNA